MQISQGTKRHKFSRAITGAVLAGLLFPLIAIPAHAATTTVHTATVYGVRVVGGRAANDKSETAVAVLPACSTASALTVNASSLSVSTALATTGANASSSVNTADTSTGSSSVAEVSLLGGIITATEVDAVSASNVSGSVFQSSSAGSTFTNLMILGKPIPADVAPNTVITLPSLGSVTLNEQTLIQTSDMSQLKVIMIDVSINQGTNAGTEIFVGHALSGIKSQSVPATVGGYAYSPTLTTGTIVEGEEPFEIVPCFGTNGAVETDSGISQPIPGTSTAKETKVTGTADLTESETSVKTTTSTDTLTFLGGFYPQYQIKATKITSEASGITTDGVTFNFSGGSTFEGLTMAGYPAINDDVAPNTEIKLPNVGDLYFNVVEIKSDKITIIPIKFVITAPNLAISPLGTVITVGAAEAQLHSTAVP